MRHLQILDPINNLVARGYFTPGGASQGVGGPGSGVQCRALSDGDSDQSPMMPHYDGFGHWYSNFWNRPHGNLIQFEWALPFGES